MRQAFDRLLVATDGQRLYEITERVCSWVAQQGIAQGLLTLYIHHTSASLLIQENADSRVLDDLNAFFRQLVTEDVRHYSHTQEGADDMPAHIRAALTATQLAIPVVGRRARPRPLARHLPLRAPRARPRAPDHAAPARRVILHPRSAGRPPPQPSAAKCGGRMPLRRKGGREKGAGRRGRLKRRGRRA